MQCGVLTIVNTSTPSILFTADVLNTGGKLPVGPCRRHSMSSTIKVRSENKLNGGKIISE